MRESVQHLVIGGGPAGSMVALRLASSGRDVMLLEKEREPHHKVCGEFLSPEAIGYLQDVGIEPRDLGAQSIQRVRLHSGRHTVESNLPFTALSLSRRVLDQALLERASSAGCDLWCGAFVESLQTSGKSWTVQLRGGHSLQARTVFLATGKHDVNGWSRAQGSQSDLVGFKMHWQLDGSRTETLRGWMELFLFREGYGGLSLVDNNTANFCFVVRRGRLRELGGWTEVLSAIRREVPGINERLHAATPCWTRPLAISPIPYGHLGGPAKGLWRIGDQSAVIPSFTGDGMSIALHSARLAARMYVEGRSPDDFLQSVTDQLRPGMRVASALSQSMITSAGRTIAPTALALIPGMMSWIVNQTRIPGCALLDSRAEERARVNPPSASLA